MHHLCCLRIAIVLAWLCLQCKQYDILGILMDTLGIEPRASRMLSGCDTTTPRALNRYLSAAFNICQWQRIGEDLSCVGPPARYFIKGSHLEV